MTIPDLIAALCWSLAGFLAGWLVGRAGKDVHQIKEAVVSDDTDHPPPPRRAPVDRVRLTGAAVLVVAVASVAAMSWQVTVRQRAVECQLDVMSRSAQITNARAELAAQDREALNTMIAAVFRPGDQGERQAYRDYLATLAANAQAREALTFPTDDCTKEK